MSQNPQHFHQQAKDALADTQLRANFRGAMDYLREKRQAAFNDPQEEARIRDIAESIRQRCLSKLPELLEQLEFNCYRNGIQVHWADTPDQANALIASIAKQHNAKQIIKGKSMVSEEIEMNHAMEKLGINCLESDMGEYIVQLDGDKPSHIIMPAIHKNKQEVSDTFEAHLDNFTPTDDVDSLIQTGRTRLRKKFFEADIGLSGVNFAVAETGTLCLVENEGNGRMSTTVPNVHIAITGIEKVVEFLSDVPPLYSALTRSATGQAITTYFNMISSPRKPGEKDGPEEVHLVLLDNGRSQAYQDEELRKTLQCIRCGACMNHCPVYTKIGGHAYGTVYPGPIGKIISPHLLGLDKTKDLVTASSLCGACGEVCPVKIPIPEMLLRLRKEAKQPTSNGNAPLNGQNSAHSTLEAALMKSYAVAASSPSLYHSATYLATKLQHMVPNKLGAWTQCRTSPKPAAQTLHQQLKSRRLKSDKSSH
ncbi:iron-sulfur cluster-binding protein [Vibrio sp. 10N.286.49.C2]|uniref:LutB/LldF family L-lactate oxidation iron-sulfur protein n=1 Tax=unclassified Vibrio TaxID=2614977 RepID=UPI000C82AD2D|nr:MULTISPECIES: LutB/LldF family L-lactate oxidation iron-sulfur protein [unclassified Vibrio]PMH43338.1 iron-sulfur cluster-binding protein [Vibrio sp. 10N.286.49.C2]PMH56990.1 iron-sulfur cluster-binding protein [Vibrio sp. 10N.286.49.B1]PMH79126.1 iron-sulfur cluster-binding protein [Vibrio sp. 10N.286.48.B7]